MAKEIVPNNRHYARQLKEKQKIKKVKDQRQKRLDRKKCGLPAGVPHTLESLRIPDKTILSKDDIDIKDEEDRDEFVDIYNGTVTPKILITFSDRANMKTKGFIKELSKVFPNSLMLPRYHTAIKKFIVKAIEKGFTAAIIVNEDNGKINNLVITYLPHGPTLTFRVSNIRPHHLYKGSKGKHLVVEEDVIPQLLTNRFITRVGRRVERCIGALFPAESRVNTPKGHNRAVILHNQRDFIFFRGGPQNANGYEGDERVITNEIGPRMTLKLKSIQVGTFDTKYGDFEWRPNWLDMNHSKRSFVI